MANLTAKTINELPEATTIYDASLLALSQSGNSRRITIASLRSAILNASLIDDADSFQGSGDKLSIYRVSPTTLHTPYTDGVSLYTYGLIFAYSSAETSAIQVCALSGTANLFLRRKYQGNWSTWTKVLVSTDIPVFKSGVSVCAVESNKVKATRITFDSPFSATPSVVACFGGSFEEEYPGLLAAVGLSVTNITTDGFDVFVGLDRTSAVSSIAVRWQAIGR